MPLHQSPTGPWRPVQFSFAEEQTVYPGWSRGAIVNSWDEIEVSPETFLQILQNWTADDYPDEEIVEALRRLPDAETGRISLLYYATAIRDEVPEGSHWIHSDSPSDGDPYRPGRTCGPRCDLYVPADEPSIPDAAPLAPVPGWGTCPICGSETSESDDRAEIVPAAGGPSFLAHAECYLGQRDDWTLA